MGGCSQSSVKRYAEQAHKPSSAKENGSDDVHELRQLRVATEVGGRLRDVVEVERRRKQDDPSYFMRVKVALPVSKPLRRGGFLAGSDDER